MRGVQGYGMRLPAAVFLSSVGVVVGWSAAAGSGIGLGLGVAAATLVLATMVRLPVKSAPFEPVLTSSESGWQEAQRELDRARRHERPFVLIRVPSPHPGASGNGHAGTLDEPESLGRSLRVFLRSIDTLWASEGHLYLLLPESTRSMGEALLSRVREAEPDLLPEADLVAFPEDGVTGGALVALLHGQHVAHHSIPFTPEPDPIHRAS